MIVCLNVTFRIDHLPSAGQKYLQWWPTYHPAPAFEGALYSCKAAGSHIDTLDFHTCCLSLRNSIVYYNMVGFSRHKYKGAESVANSYIKSRMGWPRVLPLAQIGSHSLLMAGMRD